MWMFIGLEKDCIKKVMNLTLQNNM